MEFLVLAPTPTWPNDLGSRKGIVSIHQRLKLSGRVHFLLYAAEGEWRDGYDSTALAGMRQQWDSVELIAPSRQVHTHALGEDHSADEWWDESIGEYLKWRFSRSQFDSFIVHYTWLSKALDYAPRSTYKVLYTADQFSGRRELFEARGLRKEFFHLNIDEEAYAISRADTVVAVKKEEQSFFEKISPKHIITIPHFEPKINVRERGTGEVLKFAVVGGYNTINVQNFREFMAIAEPIFSRSFAPIEIVVSGGICEGLRDFHSPYVKMTGHFERAEDVYEAVDAVIVPMIWSSGIKIKFAEAVAASKATFSTAHAAEGYPATHPLMKCQDFNELADACVFAAFDKSIIKELSASANETWSLMSKEFCRSVDTLANTIYSRTHRVLVISSPFVDGANTFEFSRLWEVISYVRSSAICSVYIPVNIPTDNIALRKIRSVAQVYQDQELSAAFDDVDTLICLDWTKNIAERLQYFDGNIFFFNCSPSAFVDRHMDVDSGARGLIFNFNQSDALAAGKRARSVSAARRTAAFPYFWRDAGAVSRSWRNESPAKDLVHIIVDNASIKLGAAVAKALASWGLNIRVNIILVPDEMTHTHVEQFSRRSSAGDRPYLVLDVAPSIVSAAREIYERAGIPVFSILPQVKKAVYRHRTPALYLSSWGDVLDVVFQAFCTKSGITEFEEKAAFRAKYKFSSDAGWTILWRRLNGMGDGLKLHLERSEIVGGWK